MKQPLTIWVLLGLLAQATPAAQAASSAADVQADLRDVEAQIDASDARLEENRRQRTVVEADLRDLDTASAEANRRVHQLTLRVREVEQSIARTQQRIDRVSSALDAQRQLLSQHTRALHQLGDPNPIRHLFGGSSVTDTDRTLRYFGYLARAREEVIDESVELSNQLQTLRSEQRQEHEQRRRARDEIRDERNELAELAEQRRNLLAELRTAGSTEEARRAQLQDDRIRLGALLEELSVGVETAVAIEPFEDFQGQLPWPLGGELVLTYGEGTIAGRPNRTGWFIQAPEGTPVYPVHPGRVAFSGWFRGLGYLTILDHGNDYMTLYAHAGSLMLEVEDHAVPDEPLAIAGSSGGTLDAGIYFELRIAGAAADPAEWLGDR